MRPLAVGIVTLALLGWMTGAAPPVTADEGLACVGTPLRWLQDDARSGGDAGDVPPDAVPLLAEGWSFGALTVPVNDTVEDISDWFKLEVPAGPRTITFDGQNVANLLIGMGNTVPLILYYEIWRGDTMPPALEFASWAQPQTLESQGGETLHLHVYPSPLLLVEGCASPAIVPLGLGLVPDPAQTYGLFADCVPDCVG